MLIFFNWIGLGMVVLAFLVGIVFDSAVGGRSSLLAAAIVMVAMDIIYRSRRKTPLESVPYFHPKRGGNVMFIPVWIIGALVFVIALA